MDSQVNNEIIIILSKLITLLEKTEEYDWAIFFTNIKKEITNCSDKKQIARRILAVYKGGMSSFVDLILQKDMKILIEEDDDLIKYRRDLFKICRKIIVSRLKNRF